MIPFYCKIVSVEYSVAVQSFSAFSPSEDCICRMAVSTGPAGGMQGFEAVLGLVPKAQDTLKYLTLVEQPVFSIQKILCEPEMRN